MLPRTRPVSLCALALATLLIQNPASAEVDALVRDALALAESGNGAQAYALLEPQEVQRAGDPDFDLVFGIAANQAGQHARAILALERVTLVQPANARARAELGRAMFAVGDSASARTLLQQAKGQGAPNEAAQTIDDFLRAIDVAEADARSTVRGYVEATIGRDNNIGSGPSNANVAVPLFGGTITLAPNSVKQSATFGNLAAGVTGRYVIDSRWSLIGNGSVGMRANHNESTFNNNQIYVSGGAAYRVDRQEFSVVLVHEDYRLDGDKNRTQNGLVGEWVYRIDGTREAGAYVQHSRLHYPGVRIRDADRTVVGGSYAQQLGSGLLGWGGVYLGSEDERNKASPQFGHDLAGLRLGLQKTVGDDLAVFVALNFEGRRYGGPDPFFLTKRKDDQASLTLGLNWVPARSWRISPQISHVRNQSNIAINDYDRTTVSVAARMEF